MPVRPRPTVPPPAPLRRLAAAPVAAVCLLFAAGPAAVAGPPGEDFDTAAALYRKQRYAAAADRFGDFLEQHPDHPLVPSAELFLGISLYDDGDTAAALDALARGLAREGLEQSEAKDLIPYALLRQGLAEESRGNPAAAARALDRLMTEYPKDRLAVVALEPYGRVKAELGDAAAAERAFRAFLETNPPADAAARTRVALAETLTDAGRVDDAAAVLRDVAAGRGPLADEALLDLGLLEYNRGDHRSAAAEFTALLDRSPDGPLAATARLNRGFARYQTGDYAEALRDLAAAGDAGTQEAPLANLWAGNAARKLGDVDAAAGRYAKAAGEAAPPEVAAKALMAWGLLLEATGEPDDRIAAAEKYAALAERFPKGPNAPRALRAAAEMSLSAGDRQRAERLLTRFETLYPASAEAPQAALLRGRIEEAAAAEETDADEAQALRLAAEQRYAALAADAGVPASLRRGAALRRGGLLARRGELREALEVYRAVAAGLVPGEDDLHLRDALRLTAVTAADLGMSEIAADAAGRFLGTFPDDPRAGDVRAAAAAVAADAGDLDAAVAAHRELLAAGRTPRTDELAVTLADRAMAKSDEAFSAEPPDRARAVELAELAAELVAAVAADESAAPTVRAEALNALGYAEIRRRRHAEAAAAFGELLEDYPESPLRGEALVHRGIALERSGRSEEAEPALTEAWTTLRPVAPAPAGAEATGPLSRGWLAGLELARLRTAEDRPDDAAEIYADLDRLYPAAGNGNLLWEWAMTFYERQRYDVADPLLARLVSEAPDHPHADTALLYLAEGDAAAGRWDDAAAKLARLVDVENAPADAGPAIPADDLVARKAGPLYLTALMELDRPADAAAFGDRYVERVPDQPRAFALLAEARAELGHAPAARERYAAARKLADPAEIDPRTNRRPKWLLSAWAEGVRLAFEAKDHAEVDRLFAELEAWNPPPEDLFLVREVYARSLKQRSRFAEARAQAEAVTDDPASLGTESRDLAWILLADLALLAADQDSAAEQRAAFAEAKDLYLNLSVKGATPRMRALGTFQEGRMEERLGNVAAAVRAYTEVIADHPETVEAAEAAQRLEALGAG